MLRPVVNGGQNVAAAASPVIIGAILPPRAGTGPPVKPQVNDVSPAVIWAADPVAVGRDPLYLVLA